MSPYLGFDEGKYTLVGWIYQRPKKIICHVCYTRDHLSPQCPLKFFQLPDVVTTYQILTEEEKKMEPNTSFQSAKSYLEINRGSSKKITDHHPNDSKKAKEFGKNLDHIINKILHRQRPLNPLNQPLSKNILINPDSMVYLQRPWRRINRKADPEVIYILSKSSYKVYENI